MEVPDSADGRAQASVEIGLQHLNPNGVVHGAVIFAMIDTAMGKAAMSVADKDEFVATVDIQVRFIRPASGGRLSAQIEVIKRGRHVIHLEARVFNDDTVLVASAAGTFATLGT